jgi:ketosteroid isomerase-like protein
MSDDIRKEIERVSAEWEEAMIANDAKAIGRYMADEWVIVGDTGVSTKDDYLTVVASGDLTHERFKSEIVSVKQYGDTAVVTGRMRNNGNWRGHAFSADEWTTDVFVKNAGRWLCVHSQITAAKGST